MLHCTRVLPRLRSTVSSSAILRFNFFSEVLRRPIPVLGRFNVFHSLHFRFLPLNSSSFTSLVVCYEHVFFHLSILSFSSTPLIGWIVVRNHFLDLSRITNELRDGLIVIIWTM